jgi:hypothetical protein
VHKKLSQGWQVVSCYEAGPFGYVLHRQLTVLGVTNYLIRARNWDDHQSQSFEVASDKPIQRVEHVLGIPAIGLNAVLHFDYRGVRRRW